MIILGFDGLDINLVEQYGATALRLKYFGEVNLSEFNLLRTVALWGSFLSGRNIESDVANEGLWDFRLTRDATFLKFFPSYETLDVPAFSYRNDIHAEERRYLKAFFGEELDERGRNEVIEKYNKVCWKNHATIKGEFFSALSHIGKGLLFAYFSLTDTIAHLNYSNSEEMSRVYKEAEKVLVQTRLLSADSNILIVSDHGMQGVGRFGDHRNRGFWATTFNPKFEGSPRITDFYHMLKPMARVPVSGCS